MSFDLVAVGEGKRPREEEWSEEEPESSSDEEQPNDAKHLRTLDQESLSASMECCIRIAQRQTGKETPNPLYFFFPQNSTLGGSSVGFSGFKKKYDPPRPDVMSIEEMYAFATMYLRYWNIDDLSVFNDLPTIYVKTVTKLTEDVNKQVFETCIGTREYFDTMRMTSSEFGESAWLIAEPSYKAFLSDFLSSVRQKVSSLEGLGGYTTPEVLVPYWWKDERGKLGVPDDSETILYLMLRILFEDWHATDERVHAKQHKKRSHTFALMPDEHAVTLETKDKTYSYTLETLMRSERF